MCLILVGWQAHPDYPLVVAANRDEFYQRRTASADFWAEHPHVLAGRDLEAGGTWLGIARQHSGGYRFAALTNFRDPARQKPDAPSRGHLVAGFLTGTTEIDAYLDALPLADYNGFNLLLGDGRRLVACSNISMTRHELAPGVYGLSNALLDTPWPKVGVGKTALAAALQALPDETALFDLLRDDRIHADDALPATGVSLEWERLLSAAFVRSNDYGTRNSTVVKVGVTKGNPRGTGGMKCPAWGTATFVEQTWLPDGRSGECRRHLLKVK